MATATTNYASVSALTIGLASLATSSTWVAGRESTVVDNSSNKYIDAIVQGQITVGTTPTANTSIQIWVYASFDDSPATTAIDVIDGADSDETMTNVGVRNSALAFATALDVSAATSNVAYPIKPFSVASLFGGVLPKYWGVWVTHNTGVALNSTAGNHVVEFVGIKYDIA